MVKQLIQGAKRVYRFYDKTTGYALGDVIALATETIATDHYTLVHPVETWKKTTLENYEVRPLLEPIFRNGELVYEDKTLQEKQDYCKQEFQTLYPEVTRLEKPHEYYVDLSEQLRELKHELICLHQNNNKEKGSQLVKK